MHLLFLVTIAQEITEGDSLESFTSDSSTSSSNAAVSNGAAAVSYGSFSLNRSIKCKSFNDISKSSPCSKRNARKTIYIGTDAPRHCLTQIDYFS